jgi:hypothetical protein
MTVPELIADVLRRIQSTDWYHGRVREFARDQRALTKAIARYGYACNERGWHFQPNEILADLVGLLRDIVNKGADIQYFPLYLESAVDKHIRQRAEELNERAKRAKRPDALTTKIIQGTEVVRVVEKSAVEVLDTLYRDLKAQRKAKVKRAAAPAKQGVLL